MPNENLPAHQPVTLDINKAAVARSWVQYEHPEYTANKAKWTYATDVYSGKLLEKLATYLIRRATGESDAAYEERQKLADFTPVLAQAVEGLVGMLFAVEGDANRIFADENGVGLGKVDDPATPIGKLWTKADPDGNGYLAVFKSLGIELTVCHKAWIFIDPAANAPQVRILPALSVPNWIPGPGGSISEAMITEEADARASLSDAVGTETRYLHITSKGWQRYRIDSTGKEQSVGEPGTWAFETRDGQPCAPIRQVKLVLRRPIGYIMARKAVMIFNKESERDFAQRIASFVKLVLSADESTYKNLEEGLAKGSNVLQESPDRQGGGHRYINPPTENVAANTETLKQKIELFHQTFHRSYDDSAVQRTATEVRQEVGSGTGAFLQLLKAALDDGENDALWFLEQAFFSGDRAKWGIARVERTEDFMPADPDAVMEKSANAAFGTGKQVPMGATAAETIALQIAESRGANVNPDELKAHVRVRTMIDILESAPTSGLEIPAEVRAEIVMLAIAAAGLIPGDAMIDMEDGSKRKKLDVLRDKALQLMQAADDERRRNAELLAGGGGDPGGNPTGGNGGQEE